MAATKLRFKRIQHADRIIMMVQDNVRDLADQIQKAGLGAAPAAPFVPSAGSMIGRAYADDGGVHVATSHDVTEAALPTHAEGTSIVTLNYTLAKASNKLRIRGQINGFVSAPCHAIGLLWDSTVGPTLAGVQSAAASANYSFNVTVEGEYSPGDTNQHTYELRAGGDTTNGTSLDLNYDTFHAAAMFGGKSRCWILIEEYAH